MRRPQRSPRTSGPSAAGGLADEELMQFVRRADPRAFELIYDRHAAAAFSLAYRMCGSAAAAEDVTQEAFLAVWRGGGRYDQTRGSVRTWVLGIVHNRAIDALRRSEVRSRRQTGDEGLADRLEAPERTEAEAARRQEAASLRGLIEQLPDEQSRVIELAYFGGFTSTEIARMLDAPLGTVKGRMRLALQKLRAGMDGPELTEARP